MRLPLIGAALFAGVTNLLALAGPLFMLEIYDRVLPSLVALLLLVCGLYIFSGLLDIIRARVMTRAASAFDAKFSKQVFTVIAGVSLKSRINGDALKPVI